jgi:hypothetical protein
MSPRTISIDPWVAHPVVVRKRDSTAHRAIFFMLSLLYVKMMNLYIMEAVWLQYKNRAYVLENSLGMRQTPVNFKIKLLTNTPISINNFPFYMPISARSIKIHRRRF